MILSVGLLSVLAFRVLLFLPPLAEAYATTVNPVVLQVVSLITGILPISLAELVVIGYPAVLVVLSLRGILSTVRGRRRWRNLLGGGALRVTRDAGFVLFVFYASWGFNYARPPLRLRLGWAEFTTPPVDTLAALAELAVTRANEAYVLLHGSTDAGTPTQLTGSMNELANKLELGWIAAQQQLGLPRSVRRNYGNPKKLLLTPIVARFGIAGFFFPWTAEANVLRDSPAVSRVSSMAHEMAHQRGTGPEAEANFLGFVAGINSPDQLANYSAWVFAQVQLLAVLRAEDHDRGEVIATQRYAGIVRDLDDLGDYWDRYRGALRRVGRGVNDRFLRANRVSGGIANYGMSVRLIITFMEEHSPTQDS
ncbi:MAG: DUF3810 domain-containing protein [Gemmatimonadales bacterium]